MDGLQGARLRGGRRRADRHRRAERRRQVHAAAHPRRPRDSRRRARSCAARDWWPPTWTRTPTATSGPRRRRSWPRAPTWRSSTRELRAVEQELARPDVVADLARMDARPRPAAGAAGPVGGDRRAGPGRAGAEPAAASLGHPGGGPRAADEPALRRPAQAGRAGRVPDHAAGPAAAGRARDAPGRRSPRSARGADRRVPGRRGRGLARPLPAGRDGRPRSPSSTTGGSRCGRATTRRSPSRSRSRCSASSSCYVTQQKEIARLEEAIARFKLWASIVVDERHIKQARNKQRQIDRMDKIDRPVFERRKIALEMRSRAARRAEDRRAARRHDGVRRRPGAAGRGPRRSRAASASA